MARTAEAAPAPMIIDTHLHLFDPASHPFTAAGYRPLPQECAGWPYLRDLLDVHGVRRGVLVAPTVGHDHDLSPLRAKLAASEGLLVGVTRPRGDEDDAPLDALARSGVRGVRLDPRQEGIHGLHELTAAHAPARWARRGWWVQIQAQENQWAQVADTLAAWPVDLVVDHASLPDPAQGPSAQALLARPVLAQSGAIEANTGGQSR